MNNLDVHPRTISSLKKARITDLTSLLSRSAPDIERATHLSLSDVKAVQREAALAVTRRPLTNALDMYNNVCPQEMRRHTLSLGCKILDGTLQGGFQSQGITEIAGESASGKTQLCMQLCLTVQLPTSQGGLEGGAAYICTEDVFPNKRLVQMIQHFGRTTASKINFGDNIFIEHTSDMDSLWYCLKTRVPALLNRFNIKLIVIDSVAALFRYEYSLNQTFERSKKLSLFGAYLHNLSCKHNIPVVCINQVTENMNGYTTNGAIKKTLPALGLTWSNLVTTRIVLSRTPHTLTVGHSDNSGDCIEKYETPVRAMEIIFDSHLPNNVCHYVIDQEGVKGIS
ncbi:unnamed protein product [Owenia fusiformis]|uniref:RecA family profile 1 domain-containing protein n=1 Tax=Owenia fusiformis TaxID=6347 RepID=A0A8S4PDP5_OWEFU|nr:unnamed protein product [Owenia fusiformis]